MGVFAGESFSSKSCEYVPLIRFFALNYEQSDYYYYYINLKCRNKHSFNIPLNKFKNYINDLREKLEKNKQKDNKDINMDDFIYDTVKEKKIYDDTKCEKHKKDIEKICKKCQINLCNECQHVCDGIINIKDYLLKQEEKNELENILTFLDKILSQSEFNNLNDDLYFLVSLIINRYLKNKYSYEIIQNCKNCLNFNCKNELTEIMDSKIDFNDKIIKVINLYDNQLLLNPSYIINLSKIINIKSYEIHEFENKNEKYYWDLIDLSEKRFALYNSKCFDVFDKDSFKLIFSYEFEKQKEENYSDNIFLLLHLKNDNLVIFKNNLILIYQILDNSLKKINEKKSEEKILNAIQIENKKIIATTKNDILLYNFINNNLELQLKIVNFNLEEEIYESRLIDLKDSQNILIYHGETKGYFNYKEKKFTKKEENNGDNTCILFNNDLLIELEGYMNIRDIKTFNIINSHEMDTPSHKIYKLNDGSFLCGLYSKHELYLQQFVYEYDNVIDLDIISFPNNRGHFGFIHQFKNGEIILDANGIIYILN